MADRGSARELRREVLDREREAQRLEASGGTAQRPLLRELAPPQARRRWGEAPAVVHDQLGAGLGRVGDQPVERAVVRRQPRAQVVRAMDHEPQPRQPQGSSQGSGMVACRPPLPQHRARGVRTWIQANPAAS